MLLIFDNIIKDLISLSKQTGETIMSSYDKNEIVNVKDDKTPVTIADKNAHIQLEQGLKKITPNIPVISEEGAIVPFSQRSRWEEYWLIDPLDGTREFMKKTGEFCICIAYIKNHIPKFGMIYSPINKTHYYTTSNNKAFKLQHNKLEQLIIKKKRQVSKIVIGRHSQENKDLQKHLKKYPQSSIFQLGSALKFCKIAEGKYDYYPRFGNCSEWDIAAGIHILQTAGGTVRDENGSEIKFNTKESFLTPVFFASS